MRTLAALGLLLLALATGCRHYAAATPRQTFEGDDVANYCRVFEEEPGKDVTVVDSVVIGYSYRPGVVTSDDWEFKLVVPESWIAAATERFFLRPDYLGDTARRAQNPIREWYRPDPDSSYKAYRDPSSVGYVHPGIFRRLIFLRCFEVELRGLGPWHGSRVLRA